MQVELHVGGSRRQRKKQQTRDSIVEAAWRLFIDRGFDSVTVEDIARAADIDRKTVYNHFESKEDLVFRGAFVADLVTALRDRAPGESILAAFISLVTDLRRWRLQPDHVHTHERSHYNHLIAGSATLQAGERALFDRYTTALAALITEEIDVKAGDITPWVAANALVGVLRALAEYNREAELSGKRPETIAKEIRKQAALALQLLDADLGQLGASGKDRRLRAGG